MQHRLGDERGYRVSPTHVADRIKIIEVDGVHEACLLERGAGAERPQRVFTRRHSRPDVFKRVDDVAGELVVITVVAALHDDEMRSASDGAAQANRE